MSSPKTLCLNMIVKNEMANLERCAEGDLHLADGIERARVLLRNDWSGGISGAKISEQLPA